MQLQSKIQSWTKGILIEGGEIFATRHFLSSSDLLSTSWLHRIMDLPFPTITVHTGDEATWEKEGCWINGWGGGSCFGWAVVPQGDCRILSHLHRKLLPFEITPSIHISDGTKGFSLRSETDERKSPVWPNLLYETIHDLPRFANVLRKQHEPLLYANSKH